MDTNRHECRPDNRDQPEFWPRVGRWLLGRVMFFRAPIRVPSSPFAIGA